MEVRSRILDSRKYITGQIFRGGRLLKVRSGFRGSSVTTDDVVGNFEGDNPFETDRQKRLFATLDGLKPGGATEFRHCPLYGVAVAPFPSTLEGLSSPNLYEMAPLWAGSLTPRAQAINAGTFVGELPDLPSLFTQTPSLIMDWGRRRLSKNASTAANAARVLRDAAGDVGSTYLGAKFGWTPLMGDLARMLGILKAIMANIEMLKRLRDGRSIKRSLRLSPQIVTVDKGTQTLESFGSIVRARVTQVNSCTSWVTARWESLFPGRFRRWSDTDIWNEAVRTAIGGSLGGIAEAWWELLPWSWLTDWFMDVAGQMARFARNGWLLRCKSLCYMRTSQVHVYYAHLPPESWVQISGQSLLHRVVKERIPLQMYAQPSPSDPTPSQPVLTNGQMGILSALLAQKQKGIRL